MAKHCSHCAVGLCFSSFVCNSFIGPTLKMHEQCLMLQNALSKHTLSVRLRTNELAFCIFFSGSHGYCSRTTKNLKTQPQVLLQCFASKKLFCYKVFSFQQNKRYSNRSLSRGGGKTSFFLFKEQFSSLTSNFKLFYFRFCKRNLYIQSNPFILNYVIKIIKKKITMKGLL